MKIRGREGCAAIVFVYENGYGLVEQQRCRKEASEVPILVMCHGGSKRIIAPFVICIICIVRDPHAWRPSIAFYSRLSLPTNRWFGTPEIPGGFTPLSRVPSSRFEAVAVTEGILFRKNLEPFRITGNVFYSYNFPGSGSESGVTVYGGDLINTHLALEHVLDEETGFGYLIEMTTLRQLNGRLDGHAVNTVPAAFWLVGLQPGLEYTFARYESGAKLVGAIGVMFTVAAQDDIRAIYPNLSFKYFFEQN